MLLRSAWILNFFLKSKADQEWSQKEREIKWLHKATVTKWNKYTRRRILIPAVRNIFQIFFFFVLTSVILLRILKPDEF